jgi:murein DD-endopeptidase MepM/ murein hydrolase activator NlpD
MAYLILAPVFFISLMIIFSAIAFALFKPAIYLRHKKRIQMFLVAWFAPYLLFVLFFTGPKNLNEYPPKQSSPYKLPWKGGVKRFVAQGNRSFTSHRDFNEYAWDFVMPNGTEILAARDGIVSKIEVDFEGIGVNSNIIELEHEDGQRSGYAHIAKNGALVKLGEKVKQGQPIALSGMVGQTIFPHVHFFVTNKERTSSIPVTFADVDEGIPRAGRIYVSGNN